MSRISEIGLTRNKALWDTCYNSCYVSCRQNHDLRKNWFSVSFFRLQKHEEDQCVKEGYNGTKGGVQDANCYNTLEIRGGRRANHIGV